MNKFTRLLGHECEITVRGLRSFTVSFDSKNEGSHDKIKEFLGADVDNLSFVTDEELEETFVYFDIPV